MNLMMAATPPQKAGSAAALSETSGEFGVAMGVAFLGSIAAVTYRSRLVLPWDVPADVDRAARHGVTEAMGVARDLPGPLAADVLDAARTAFTAGMTTVAGIGVVVFTGLAVLVAVAFRRVPVTPSAPDLVSADAGHRD
jgi:DHA2 family multidrug resistance protein-like MFS transporter